MRRNVSEEILYFGFLEGSFLSLSPVSTVSLQRLSFYTNLWNIIQLTGLQSDFCQFFWSAFVEKSWTLRIYWKQLRHSPLLFASFTFDYHLLQTHLQEPFDYCLTALTTSLVAGVGFSGSRKFSAGEFSAKIFENPFFSEGKCYFSHFSILKMVRWWNKIC